MRIKVDPCSYCGITPEWSAKRGSTHLVHNRENCPNACDIDYLTRRDSAVKWNDINDKFKPRPNPAPEEG